MLREYLIFHSLRSHSAKFINKVVTPLPQLRLGEPSQESFVWSKNLTYFVKHSIPFIFPQLLQFT